MSFDALWDSIDGGSDGPGDPTKPKPPAKGAFDALWDQTPAPTPPRSGFYNAVNAIDNAATFGLGTKFNAAWEGLDAKLHGRDTFSHAYTESLNSQHAGIKDAEQRHPAIVGSLQGAAAAVPALVASPFVAAGEIGRGLPMAQRMLGAAKSGATFGSLAALGNAPNEGGIGRTLATAGGGAAAGGLLGAASVPAIELVAQAAQKVGTPLSRAVQRLPMLADETAAPAMQRVTPEAGAVANGAAGPQRLYVPPQGVGFSDGVDKPSEILIQRLQRAGLTPSDALAIAERAPANKPLSVMELAGDQSHPVVQLGKLVARTPSSGAAELRSAIASRAEGMPTAQRVLGDASKSLGVDRTDMVGQSQKLLTERATAARPFYAAAMQSQPVPFSATTTPTEEGTTISLADLFKRPSMQNAIKFHNDIAAEQGEPPITLGGKGAGAPRAPVSEHVPPGFTAEQWDQVKANMRAQGMPVPGAADAANAPGSDETVPMDVLHRVKLKLDDMIGYAKNGGQFPDGTAATRDKLRAVQSTRNALLDIMDNHSPDYRQARNTFASHSALMDASQAGRDFLSLPIDELRTQYAQMTPGEQEQFKMAALSGPVRDKIFKSPGVDLAKTITATPDLQERLQVIVPDQQELSSFLGNMKMERGISRTNQAITGGSDTFENALNSADAGATVLRGLVRSAKHGGATGVLTSLFDNALESGIGRYLQGVTEKNANALAPKLTAGMTSRDDLVQMLNELADQHARLMNRRPTPPLMGAAFGSSVGKLPGQNY